LIAWERETGYVDGLCPTTLHEVILARIAHLEDVRLRALRQRASWSETWMRGDIVAELDAVETEIGQWLDRLETGDYADRKTVAGYVERLQRVEFELFLVAALLGRPRPRSTRLREALERLFLSSSDSVLADMTQQAEALQGREDQCLAEAAERAADIAADNYRWNSALHFYDIAERTAPHWRQSRLAERRQIIAGLSAEPAAMENGDIIAELECNPSIDAVRLPAIWLRLGHHFCCRRYYLRALRAAQMIDAPELCAAIEQRLERLAHPG
jgi:hypothetical protein